MIIANRLIFFLAVLLTYKTCTNTATTPKQSMDIKRVAYVALLISLGYIVSALIFEALMLQEFQYGNFVVTNLVTVALCSLLTSFLSFQAPRNKTFLTTELKKMMVCIQLLLCLSTFTLIEPNEFFKEILIYSTMYFLFSFAFAGVQDRLEIAPIPDFLKGYPLDLLTLFLFLLSFSFLNGVFFDQLF